MEALGKDVKPLQGFIIKLNNDLVLNLACIIAYTMLMAMFPAVLALVAILSIFLGNISTHTTVIHQIIALFPRLAGPQNVLDLASKQLSQASGFIGIAAIILGIFFDSFLFLVTERCLDGVYRVRQRPPVRQFIMASGMLIAFVILIPIMVFASAAPTLAFSNLRKYLFSRIFQAVATSSSVLAVFSVACSPRSSCLSLSTLLFPISVLAGRIAGVVQHWQHSQPKYSWQRFRSSPRTSLVATQNH